MTLTKQEQSVWYKYSKMRGNGLYRCKINQLNIDCQPKHKNHREHELCKFHLFYDHTEQGHKVITEAWENSETRRDIVCLTCNEIIEIDNSKVKRGRRHPKEINVYWYDLKRFRTKEEAEIDERNLKKL